MIRRVALLLGLITALGAGELAAQPTRRQKSAPGARAAAPRSQLEARLRRGLWRVVKNRIGLTDAQMTQLAEANRSFDARRKALAAQERAERQALRREALAGASADQPRIAASIDKVLQIQRQRVDLQIEEQHALAAFMTPLQRAKYAALQEQLRRRADRLRGQRAGTDVATDSSGSP
jgi:Spy/CpxP family protein refolding chaperone